MKNQKETRYVKTFSVRVGTIRSIFDMMRYDQCFPATESDASKLARLSSNDNLSGEDRVVKFTSVSRVSNATPTVERWQSFGCEILQD